MEDEVRLGKVVRALGLDGRLGVAGSEGALGRLGQVWLRRPGAPRGEPRRVAGAARQGKLWALRLDGVGDRGAAEALVGCEVLARREDLAEQPERFESAETCRRDGDARRLPEVTGGHGVVERRRIHPHPVERVPNDRLGEFLRRAIVQVHGRKCASRTMPRSLSVAIGV